MPDPPTFGSQWWEQHYRDHEPDRGLPSVHLVDEVAGLPVGTALDAGCGTGADALWLAEQGWRVTAIDISPTVVDRAERWALDEAPEAAARIAWEVADLTAWDPATPYDLVVSQYVHPDVPFADFVARLAAWVAPGGTLFVAGHDRADSHSAAHAPEQASIDPDVVVSALSPDRWDVAVAETRSRQVMRGSAQLTMHDLVVKARRSPTARA
jgi:2-polyprenyl-3-methyl-5-hydroxy-6-metoxy-1,4-benzoquinol methylase